MCGIFGWQFKQDVKPEQKAVVAAVLCTNMDDRGGDSYGLYVPGKDLLKRGLGDISTGVSVAALAKHNCLFAHTRKATTGNITKANAHPFRFDRIVGAHNGMISNFRELNAAYDRNCTVDSQHLFLHLEEGEDLDEIEAYGTVEFVDRTEPDQVYLATFNDGDLAVYGGDWGVVWASTATPIEHALGLAGLKGWEYETEDFTLYYAINGELRVEKAFEFDVSPYRTPFKAGFDYRSLTSCSDDGWGIDEATGQLRGS